MGLCGTNYSPFLTCLLKSHHEHFLPSCELPKGKDGPGESPAHTRLGMRGSQRRGCLIPDPVRSPDLVNRHTCLCLHSSLTEGLYSELQNKTSTKVTGFQNISAGVWWPPGSPDVCKSLPTGKASGGRRPSRTTTLLISRTQNSSKLGRICGSRRCPRGHTVWFRGHLLWNRWSSWFICRSIGSDYCCWNLGSAHIVRLWVKHCLETENHYCLESLAVLLHISQRGRGSGGIKYNKVSFNSSTY